MAYVMDIFLQLALPCVRTYSAAFMYMYCALFGAQHVPFVAPVATVPAMDSSENEQLPQGWPPWTYPAPPAPYYWQLHRPQSAPAEDSSNSDLEETHASSPAPVSCVVSWLPAA